jgi:NADPH:quinone reductase-like Zn-dependent oxidoreductase
VASFFVNPATVLAMVRHVLKVPRGSWLLQSAAGSALGRMIIRLGRRDGFKTLNVVRRREAIEELTALGGDAVIASSDGPIDDQVRRMTGGDGVRHAVDPVGGDTGTGIFRSLAAEGHMLVYGTLSGEPIRIDPRLMIAGKRVVEGFWLGHWMRQQSIPAALKLFHDIADLIRTGVLATEVGASYPPDAIADAVRAAEVVGRHGKILLRISNGAES